VARRSPALGPVVRHRDVVATSLLANDDEAMRAFVRSELGGLGAADATTERLRATVLAYLSTGSSARAAELLTVHKNTVLYRLQQATELLGRPLDERRFELEAALRLASTYGEDVLAG
jgi:DNA-binding PucR family transcriptional regulator